MKLVIFGATGTVGEQAVQQALEQGHAVTAFARNLTKLNIQHPQLRLAQGDVMDSVAVEAALQGQDAVLCVSGALIDGPRTGHYRHSFPSCDRNITLQISRADVADFILKQLSDQSSLYQSPSLSY